MTRPTRIAEAHRRLLETITSEAAETAPLTGRDHFSPAVMAAMAAVERSRFIDERDRSAAYANRPLSIGHGQTISQPFIVALMTDLLDLAPGDRVLEIGTGSGYQAAVLASVCAHVVSVERIAALADAARDRLAAVGYANVEVHTADGFAGWPAGAPYDRIIVTAAPLDIPPALVEQLAPGGRLVIPIGAVLETQTLYRCVKRPYGRLVCESILPVAFVPMLPSADHL